jgi:hypothetical protein
MIQRINATKSWFSEKTNKMDKPLVNMSKRKRAMSLITKIRD